VSRDILITLAVACDNITCGACRNYQDKHCKVFGKKPRILEKSYSAIPERLPECLEAERFAKGDWETRMRAALLAEAATGQPSKGAT
jgi:hypothetical protein